MGSAMRPEALRFAMNRNLNMLENVSVASPMPPVYPSSGGYKPGLTALQNSLWPFLR